MLRRPAVLIAFVASITLLLAACVPGGEPADVAAEEAVAEDGATEADGVGDAGSAGAPADAESAPAAGGAPPAPPPLAAQLTLPPGIAGVRWAEGLVQPAAIAFDAEGRLLVAQHDGRVWLLHDGDGDGLADDPQLFAEGMGDLRGIAIGANGDVYLTERDRLLRARDRDGDGVAESVRPILRGLPTGLHGNGGVAEGPDGLLYVGLGSTCNDCPEGDPFSASVLIFDPHSAQIAVHASGLRNPTGIAFSPDGRLWATDQGARSPCASPDELNLITRGAHYGWPSCTPETGDRPDASPAVAQLGMGTGASGLAWFESDLFAEEFRRGFFIALATLPRTAPAAAPTDGAPTVTGSSVQFLRLYEDGRSVLREFAVGFQRPIDVAAGPDNGIYVADAGSGVIYRIGAPFDD